MNHPNWCELPRNMVAILRKTRPNTEKLLAANAKLIPTIPRVRNPFMDFAGM
jgi:hypothetical protein